MKFDGEPPQHRRMEAEGGRGADRHSNDARMCVYVNKACSERRGKADKVGETGWIRLHAFQSRLHMRGWWCGTGGLFRDGTYVNLVIPHNAQLILLLCMVCWRAREWLCYVKLGKGVGWVC